MLATFVSACFVRAISWENRKPGHTRWLAILLAFILTIGLAADLIALLLHGLRVKQERSHETFNKPNSSECLAWQKRWAREWSQRKKLLACLLRSEA